MKPRRAQSSAREEVILNHLTLADEIVVLMLHDETGAIRPACTGVANIAIAGGILMELSLLGRIDTDLTSLFIVDSSPVGDKILDQALQQIATELQKRSSAWWIERLGLHNGDLSGLVLERLVEAGILRAEDQRFLWVFSRRAYPQNSGREEREAKARLMSVIFDDTLPNPRDTLLVSLADSSGILDQMLNPKEMRKASKRIADVVALEEISRSVRAIVSNRRMALAAAASGRSWVGPGRDW
jgi:Golgi phosphoprotein 3